MCITSTSAHVDQPSSPHIVHHQYASSCEISFTSVQKNAFFLCILYDISFSSSTLDRVLHSSFFWDAAMFIAMNIAPIHWCNILFFAMQCHVLMISKAVNQCANVCLSVIETAIWGASGYCHVYSSIFNMIPPLSREIYK